MVVGKGEGKGTNSIRPTHQARILVRETYDHCAYIWQAPDYDVLTVLGSSSLIALQTGVGSGKTQGRAAMAPGPCLQRFHLVPEIVGERGNRLS